MAGLDDGGRCLMDEINALFAPPGRGDAKSRAAASKNELHPYYKRPGKGHNHDCCDACGEGGDLICCDSCPASFHLSCHCPPLDEEDIPMGDWICLRCFHKEQTRLATVNAKLPLPSGKMDTETSNGSTADEGTPPPLEQISSATQLPNAKSGGNRGRGGRGGNRRQNQAEMSEEEKNKVKAYKLKYEKYLKLRPTTNSPFDALIKATQVMNAEQFKLPPELQPNEQLPFSWKWKDERQDDNDSLPKICVVCGKSTRGVPSVACDFCPNVYHLDCLDPPLCEIPTDRWMCPNHVEKFIDSNLLTSTRLSERIALWQKYARTPVNDESVRLEFFRKVRSGKLYQKSRTLKAQRSENLRVKVPQYIKNAYKNPGAGFPIERTHDLLNVDRTPRDMTQDQEEWIKGLVALQSSLAQEQIDQPPPPKKSKKKVEKKPKEEEEDSTDSECELDCEVTDEISLQTQDEIAKYLAKKGQKVTKLSREVRDFLASKKLEEIFSKGEEKDVKIQGRAALIPLDLKKRAPFPLTYRTFKIGLGSTVDLDLSAYGHCNSISKFHASIFFDQYSRTFELLNYSEHGSVVDNLIYSGDVSIHPSAPKMDPRMKRMSSNAYKENEEKPCFCNSSPAELNFEKGCEVSAVLHHGSYIRFGCLQFVFSVLTYEREEDLKPETKMEVVQDDIKAENE